MQPGGYVDLFYYFVIAPRFYLLQSCLKFSFLPQCICFPEPSGLTSVVNYGQGIRWRPRIPCYSCSWFWRKNRPLNKSRFPFFSQGFLHQSFQRTLGPFKVRLLWMEAFNMFGKLGRRLMHYTQSSYQVLSNRDINRSYQSPTFKPIPQSWVFLWKSESVQPEVERAQVEPGNADLWAMQPPSR